LLAAKTRAISAPIPADAPVINVTRSVTEMLLQERPDNEWF
jgi:hypothetical protein